ncbi:MAG: hypothetical protein WCF65_06035 [Parachlamydiaceae bacterium]
MNFCEAMTNHLDYDGGPDHYALIASVYKSATDKVNNFRIPELETLLVMHGENNPTAKMTAQRKVVQLAVNDWLDWRVHGHTKDLY